MSKDTALEFVITQYPPTRDGRYGQISGVAVAFDSDIIWVASFEDLSIGEKKKLKRGLIAEVGLFRSCKCVVFMRQRQGKAIPIGPDFQFATLYENGEVRDPAEVITEEMVEDFLLDHE